MKHLISSVFALLVQGDARSALSFFREQPEGSYTSEELAWIAEWERHLTRGHTSGRELPPLAAALIAVYEEYWRESLMGSSPAAVAEEALDVALWDLLGEKGNEAPQGCVEARLNDALRESGFACSLGRTVPLCELILWGKEWVEAREVQLPCGPMSIRVRFLDDIVAGGWLRFATMKTSGTGGWANSDEVVCLAPFYDVTSEKFLVSLLGHEAQHLWDFQRLPNLCSEDLEFRAKMAELALASTTCDSLLEHFLLEATPDSQDPHGRASHRVTTELATALFGRSHACLDDFVQTGWKRIQVEASRLLRAHTERLASGCDREFVIQ